MKRMKSLTTLLLCLALTAALLAAPAAAFDDVAADDPYANAVAAAADGGLMAGMSESSFSPAAPMTRAMAVTVIWRLAGEPAAEQSSPFTDAEPGSWYEAAVNWAWEKGIAKGVSLSLFAPNAPCSVQESAVFFFRYAAHSGLDAAVPDGAEAPEGVSPWAADAYLWASGAGLWAEGVSPTETVTRGGFAVMLNAFREETEAVDDMPPVEEPDEPPDVGYMPPIIFDPLQPGIEAGDDLGQTIVNWALQWVGVTPYVWQGTSLTTGTDDAGFIRLVYENFGISFPSDSASFLSLGQAVPYSEAKPGDIICYDGHAALYVGHNRILYVDSVSGLKLGYDATYRPILTVRRVL